MLCAVPLLTEINDLTDQRKIQTIGLPYSLIGNADLHP